MSTNTANRLICLLGLAAFLQVGLMPQVSPETAQTLFHGVVDCTIAGGFLIFARRWA